MLKDVEKTIGFTFKQAAILEQIFTHRSLLNEAGNKDLQNNERLEFLGDAVLELMVTEYLFHTYPKAEEGELTSIRSALVRKENLALVARKLDLGAHLKLSRGEEKSGGREKDYILANTFEALIGGIFLDQGLVTAQSFIQTHLFPTLKTIIKKKLYIDAKSALQEYTQEYLKCTPAYKVIMDQGPDHDKVFIVGVYVKDDLIGKGTGSSKRKAEEAAAQKALAKIKKK